MWKLLGQININIATSAKNSSNLEEMYAYLRMCACFPKLENVLYENGNLAKL